jgi:CheY-like chemotaxis protein
MKESGPLIYLVDDEPMLLELAGAILEMKGYRTERFQDPKAALQAYRSANPRPDLLMTDYAMHAMNGMELMGQVRQMEPRQKILLVSGTVAEDIYLESNVKPDGFLAKPYQAQQLADIVADVLKKG